jgi:TonB-linked SusC/RagA family outer membrane protein
MRKFASLLTMLLLVSVLAFAQTRTVTGTVRDDKGEPIPFATVTEAGTRNAVQADASGNFSIRVSDNGRLAVSATGYSIQTVTATGNTASVTLARNDQQLSEVVVTSLGVARQAKELGYSTAKVKSAELTQAAPVNLQNGLTAKVSGLSINTVNNGVFADTRITIRGLRSLTGNNQPMLIVDRVPVDLAFLNSINPNDIAEVSVLKSATATTVYGPEGVNGAIVVTTRRGTRGRPAVSASHSTQLEKVAYYPKFQKRFGSGYAPDAGGFGTYEAIEQQSWGPEFDGSMVQIGQDGPNGEKLIVPYSYKEKGRTTFFETGVTNQTDVSFSTGDFYISAQNVSVKGVMPRDENNRRTFTLKAEKEYGRFKTNFDIRYTNRQYSITTQPRIIYYGVTGTPGHVDLNLFKDLNSYFGSPNGYFTPYLDNNVKTPYFGVANWRENGRGEDIFGNGELGFKVTNWLNLTYRAGFTFNNDEATSTRGAWTYSAYHNTLRDHGTTNLTGQFTTSSQRGDFPSATSPNLGNRITSEAFANAKKTFGDFNTTALVGHTYRQSTARFLSVGSNNLGNNSTPIIGLRQGEPQVGIGQTKTTLQRFFGNASVGYKNFLFLEGAGSYDFDSRLYNPLSGELAKMSDIGYFYPSGSVSVLLHEAIPSVKESKVISYLKLRGSIGKSANANVAPYAFEQVFGTALFFPYGNTLSFVPGTTAPPTKLEPEFVRTKEAGFEVAFLANRLSLEGTYYHQDNTNQILGVQLSNTTGYTTSIRNAAAFINKGFELDLKLTPLVKLGDLNVDFSVNYANQDNEVTALVDGITELGVGNSNFAIVGKPAYTFKLTDYFRDDQGRVIVDPVTGMPTQNPNLQTFGRTIPKHILGLNLNIDWKGLSLSVVGDHRSGSQMLAQDLGTFLDDNGISERSAQNGRRAFVFPNSVYNTETDPTKPAKYVENKDVYTQTYGRLFWNSDLNTGVQTNFLASAAFWKLREVALNYTIPTKILGSRLSNVFKSATIGVNARNLAMWVPKSNVWTDPEYSTTTGNATGVSSASQMPPTRIFGANISFRF